MLLTLAVSGYRFLRDIVMPVRQLNIVTGPNGSGKSNLYQPSDKIGATQRKQFSDAGSIF